MKKPHKHAELIKAWADGAEIERELYNSEWAPTRLPCWVNDIKYRLKPEPKPDLVQNISINAYGHIEYLVLGRVGMYGELANLKLTFDGETGKLKAAEVIT